jgi:hypothetical protein
MSKTINLNRRTFGGLEVLQYAGTSTAKLGPNHYVSYITQEAWNI